MTKKKKGLSKIGESTAIVIVTAVIIGVTVIGVNGLVKAYQSQQPSNTVIENIENSNISIYNPTPEALSGLGVVQEGFDDLLGGEATTTQDTVSVFNDIIVQGCTALQDDDENEFGNLFSDIIWDCTEVIDFTDATSTLTAWQNRKGAVIWFHDETNVNFTGVPTSTDIKFAVGTSSTKYANPFTLFPGDSAAEVGSLASILYADSVIVVGSPTNTATLFKEDNQGADTRDATGERHFVPVLPGEWVLLTASSTDPSSVTSTDRTLDGNTELRYHIKYPQ